MLQEVAVYTSIAVDCITISGVAFAIWRFRKDILDRRAQQDNERRKEASLELERREREEENRLTKLRLDEVADWGKRCIHQLRLGHHYQSASVPADKIIESQASLSALIDEGRLYFKNTIAENGWNKHKAKAFQGFRPKILDPLVACYDVNGRLQTENPKRQALLDAYRRAEEDFVSLLQDEVGRTKAYAATAAAAGQGSPLDIYLKS